MASSRENPAEAQPADRAATGIERQRFGQLVKANQSGIRNYIGSLGVAPPSIDDIAQEAFLVAFKRFSTYNKDASFASWVCSIARNLLWNDRRKTRRRYQLLNEQVTEYLLQQDPATLLADEEVQSLQRAALRECLKEVSEENRNLLIAHYHDDMNSQQMAEKFGMRADSIRHRLMRVRRTLRQCIEKKTGDIQ